jgi:predicted phage terminase large subunit-like protein
MSSSGFVAKKIAAATERSSRPLLPELAARRLAEWKAKQASLTCTERRGLIDFVVDISPYLQRPTYLAPYLEALENAVAPRDGSQVTSTTAGGGLRLVFAAPPQHGKTVCTLHAFLWWDRYFPGRRHSYITFNETRAQEVAKEFIRLATAAGFEPTGTLQKVELKGGSSIKFTSVNGDLTGSPIDGCCIIDDPIRNANDARSPTVRKNAIDWFMSTAFSRRHPGTSYVAMATRWHVEDLSGYLIKHVGYRYINLKAIAEPQDTNDLDPEGRVASDPLKRFPGESLWPAHKPPSFFDEERRNIYWWAAMYQGEPRPAGGAVFSAEPNFYRELPKEGFRGGFGLDLAFTAKTSADWSICVEGVMVPRDFETTDDNGKPKTIRLNVLYVVDVQRKQVDAPSFALTLKVKQNQRPGYKKRWYAAGTEKGSVDFFARQGIKINVMPPIGDKLLRAQRVAAAWNDNRVLLPHPEDHECEWLAEFLDVVQNFTGKNDIHDDDVDALAALWDELDQKRVYGTEVKPLIM